MINITAFNGKSSYGVYHYTVDYTTELSDLYYKNALPGSEAYCIENTTSYILKSNNIWIDK